MKTNVTIGLIGAGFVGNLHAKCLAMIPGVEISAVSDLVSGRGKRLAKSMPGCKFYPDYHTILKNEQFDAVLVCTPPDSHRTIILDAIADEKDVFCEKPICTSMDDAKQIVEAVEGSHQMLSVGFMLRYSSIFNELKSFCANEELGNPIQFAATYFIRDPKNAWFWDFRRSGGMITENTIHYLDLVRYLLGEVKLVSSHTENVCHPSAGDFDTVRILLELESGVKGIIDAGCYPSVAHPSQFFSITFERGQAIVNGDKLIVQRQTNTTTLPFPSDPYYQRQMNEFVACMFTGKSPRVGVQIAVQSLRLALGATKSALTGVPVLVRDI